jgi:hypothetical protein
MERRDDDLVLTPSDSELVRRIEQVQRYPSSFLHTLVRDHQALVETNLASPEITLMIHVACAVLMSRERSELPAPLPPPPPPRPRLRPGWTTGAPKGH